MKYHIIMNNVDGSNYQFFVQEEEHAIDILRKHQHEGGDWAIAERKDVTKQFEEKLK